MRPRTLAPNSLVMIAVYVAAGIAFFYLGCGFLVLAQERHFKPVFNHVLFLIAGGFSALCVSLAWIGLVNLVSGWLAAWSKTPR